nr:MAG TPA: hypothetical protein [Caudoviricetes sp.]
MFLHESTPLYTIILMYYNNIVSKNIQLHRKWRN